MFLDWEPHVYRNEPRKLTMLNKIIDKLSLDSKKERLWVYNDAQNLLQAIILVKNPATRYSMLRSFITIFSK